MADQQRKHTDPGEPEGSAVLPRTPWPDLSGGAVIALPSCEALLAELRAFRLKPAPQREECAHA